MKGGMEIGIKGNSARIEKMGMEGSIDEKYEKKSNLSIKN